MRSILPEARLLKSRPLEPLTAGLAGIAVIMMAWPVIATADAGPGAKPKAEAPAREAPSRPEARRPGGSEPRVQEDESAVPDWRGCPYFERKLELIV